MKKISKLLITAVITLCTLTACGSSENSVTDTIGNTVTATETAASETFTEAETSHTTTAAALTESVPVSYSSTLSETETDISEESIYVKREDFQLPEVVWVSIYEIDLGMKLEQEVRIIDSDGNCYSSHYEEGSDDNTSERFLFYDNDNWYGDLLEMTSQEKTGTLSDDSLGQLLRLSENFEEYASSSLLAEYSSYVSDGGTNYLYGIYLNDNKEPDYTLICTFGDMVLCTDKKEVKDFIQNGSKMERTDNDHIFGYLYYESYSDEYIFLYLTREAYR